ncbi:hypothetical protein KAFR_0E02680 [Kazachstania africana CBS 2517]|uniref:Protein IVY1 n=1 Tax=Kazachstania africana (strain ATCC 22294 / BCRC 22015 / CBS 2517 / CECT 1963 / NBRC 1671 / NRRL Y-8276) TaxID=1071382 RepID=H2AVM0_KAZAF|nr:hypothetical protein KAFR_0E02680 [Kazachstania africana CBS 2517]CCF58420.1 hypothetical protein KAFR_0E02680 [Kazachstania africana CBS 2517]
MSSNLPTPERLPPHLSEFSSIVNNTQLEISTNGTPKTVSNVDVTTPFQRLSVSQNSRRPSSINSVGSSIADLETLITQKDVKSTKETLKNLAQASARYHKSLTENSQDSGDIAHLLEKLAKLKGCNDDTSMKLLSSSGLFHLISNHQLILAKIIKDTLVNNNILSEFDEDSKKLYSEFKLKNKQENANLKRRERVNSKLLKKHDKNLVSYRDSLNSLQDQLNVIETLRFNFFKDSYDLVDRTSAHVLKNFADVSMAQIELFENIARKGWSGGGLDDLLIGADDMFSKSAVGEDEQGDERNEDEAECSTNITTGSVPTMKSNVSNFRKDSVPTSTSSNDNDNTNEEQEEEEGENEEDDIYNNSFSLPLTHGDEPYNENTNPDELDSIDKSSNL